MSIYTEVFGGSKRKKGINSKQKGTRNELDLAKALTDWVGYEFNRVPASGGLRWKDAEGVTGDLVPENKTFPFVVETKFYANFEVKETLRKNSKIYNFYSQVCRDVLRLQKNKDIVKLPVVFARKNGMGKNWYVFFPKNLERFLIANNCLDYIGEKSGYEICGTTYKKLKEIPFKKLNDFVLNLSK
jgi:Holliday junction resolvase